MRIFIKTAPYKNNSYIQHIIEHLVMGGYPSMEHFFGVAYGIGATSWLDYSSFFLPPTIEPKQVIDQLFSPLDLSLLPQEMQMIREELQNTISDTTLLVNRIGKELYGKEFGWARFGTQVSKKLLQFEHQKYYHQNNLWVTDDDFSILQRPSSIIEQISPGEIKNVLSKSYKIRGEYYFTKIFKESYSAYVMCYFLDRLMGVWGEYSTNYLGKSYNSPVFREFFEFSNHFLLMIDADTRTFLATFPVTESFFLLARERFLETTFILQEIALILEIRNRKLVNLDQLRKDIYALKRDEVSTFLMF